MMRLRSYLLLLSSALILLTALSCTREAVPGVPGSITISVETAEMETKAGEGQQLQIAVVNAGGSVIARYPGDGSLVAASTVEFQNINPGNYTVYAVQSNGIMAAFASASTASALEGLMASASDGDPSYADDDIPMSAVGSVRVNTGGTGQVNLSLQRVCARVSLSFVNETGEAIAVSNCVVTLEQMNPQNGFLFGRTADFLTGSTPDDLVLSHAATVPIENLGSSDFANLSALVFPSRAPAHRPGYRYLCSISFTVGGTDYAFTNLPVHDRRSADIQAVGRNQHLKIETRIGKKIEDEYLVSFHFEVADWVIENPSFVWFH
jgi:hypothetical protein